MKSLRIALPLSLAMCATGAFAYQGSMQQPGAAQQMPGATSQNVPGGNPQHPGATPPYAPSQTQTPDTTQAPGAQTPSAQNPQAQTPEAQSPQSQSAQPPAVHAGPSGIDDQVNGLTTALNLSPDQQAKVKTILEDQHKQVVDLVNNSSLSHDAKLQNARALREQTITKIRGTLTSDEQKTKFDNIVQASNERIREREQQQQGNTPAPK